MVRVPERRSRNGIHGRARPSRRPDRRCANAVAGTPAWNTALPPSEVPVRRRVSRKRRVGDCRRGGAREAPTGILGEAVTEEKAQRVSASGASFHSSRQRERRPWRISSSGRWPPGSGASRGRIPEARDRTSWSRAARRARRGSTLGNADPQGQRSPRRPGDIEPAPLAATWPGHGARLMPWHLRARARGRPRRARPGPRPSRG
jgi:hypothetical protein